MIALVIEFVLLVAIFKLIEFKSDKQEFDAFALFTFIIVPMMLSALLGLAIFFLKLPEGLQLLNLFLFFLVPFFMMWKGMDYSIGDAAKFAVIVPGVVLFVEGLYAILFTQT